MRRKPIIEFLEDRTLLSISAASLIGPQTTGSTFSYQTTLKGALYSSRTDNIVGPAKFNGYSAIEAHRVIHQGSENITENVFQALNTQGYVIFGQTTDTVETSSQTNTTDTNSAPEILAPPTLVAGKTYTTKWTDTVVNVTNPGNLKSTTIKDYSLSEELLSNTPQTVTVPAGTFSAFEIQATETIKQGSNTGTAVSDTWVVPNIGFVKASTGSFTTELISYKIVGGSSGGSTAASKLVFVSPPTSTTAGTTLSPEVEVDVETSGGAFVPGNSSKVTIAMANGPAGAKIGGTLTETAVNGVATFTNLVLDKAGTYKFKVTDGSLTSATSNSFTISPAAAAKVVFTQQPTTATSGDDLTPAVIVDVEDAFGNIVTSNSSTITLTLASEPSGGSIAGTLVEAAVKGVATFSKVILRGAGTYTLKASDGKLTSAISGKIVVKS